MSGICYNPEGSTLRNDQKELLKALEVVAEICKENNLQWWLDAGTLLGAARHKGFIPWDDDVDIVMLKKDYLKLEKILMNYESDEYVFQCMQTDPEYINFFGKFRKKEGNVQTTNKRNAYYKWRGVGLDIFPIEKTNYFSARMSKVIYKGMQKHTYDMTDKEKRVKKIRLIEKLNIYIIFPVLRLIGLINPKGEYHYAMGIGWPKCTIRLQDTFPLKTALFEDTTFPVPNDVDAYLTAMYGDWKTIPSDADIKNSIHCLQYLREIYGDEQ